jgi:heme/copper-type cytochrome/quinol oxidase subunit 2
MVGIGHYSLFTIHYSPYVSVVSPSLTSTLFWIAAACCAVAQVALIWSAIRAPMSGSTESASMRMPSRASEIAWTIVPAIGLALLLVFSWRAVARHEQLSPDPHAGHSMIEE